MTFSLCEPKEPFHVMTFLDLPNAMRIGELIVNSGAVKPSNEPPMDLTLWLLRALFLNCPFIDSEWSCPHVWPPLGGSEWIWCMGLARLLLRRSTDVPSETAPRGMCRHGQVKKAFLLKCEWAEFSGIRVGLNKQVQSETRRGGGWRSALIKELAKTAKRHCHYCICWRDRKPRRTSIYQLMNSRRLQEESVGKVLFVWNGMWLVQAGTPPSHSAALLPLHYSCPKPSVSSMANMSFSFSCS